MTTRPIRKRVLSKRRIRIVPYNPNARDADGDGLVQEGTNWERPGGSKWVDRAGRELAKAIRSIPDGATLLNVSGNEIQHTPSGQFGGDDGDGIPGKTPSPSLGLPALSALGVPNIGSLVTSIDGTPPEPVEGAQAVAPDIPEVPNVPETPEAPSVPDSPLPKVPGRPELHRAFAIEDLDERALKNNFLVFNNPLTGFDATYGTEGILDRNDLPETVYHVTSAKDLVDADGVLRINAGGGGLGGGSQDDLSISLTVDRDVAVRIHQDMTDFARWLRTDPTPEATVTHLKAMAKADGWEYIPTGEDRPDAPFVPDYSPSDWWSEYLFKRKRLHPDQPNNPLFFGFDKSADPDQMAIIEIPRERIPGETLISDFDLGSSHGLSEVRVWGDIPLDEVEIPTSPFVASTTPARAAAGSTEQLTESLEDRYPDVKFHLYQSSGVDSGGTKVSVLAKIVVPEEERGTGIGTAFMDDLTAWADENDQVIALTPDAVHGGNVRRLKEFYKRHGFVDNSGRNKDFAISETMYRPPDPDAQPRPDIVDTPDPHIGTFGPFRDNADYNAQYREARDDPEKARAILDAWVDQERKWLDALSEAREARDVAKAEEIELGTPRDTPSRSGLNSLEPTFTIPGRKVQKGAVLKGGEFTRDTPLDLSEAGIKKRIDRTVAQFADDMGLDIDRDVVWTLNWEEWHAMPEVIRHDGAAVAFVDNGKLYLGPSVVYPLGYADEASAEASIRVIAHEASHAASSATKRGEPNTGLHPIMEEAGAEINSLFWARGRYSPELLEAIQARVATVDGPEFMTGAEALYLGHNYPDRIEEVILSAARRNGWDREAMLDDILYTFQDGDFEAFFRNESGDTLRIYDKIVSKRGQGTINAEARARWAAIWDQAPTLVGQPYERLDPHLEYEADSPSIDDPTEDNWEYYDRKKRIAGLLYWLLEETG